MTASFYTLEPQVPGEWGSRIAVQHGGMRPSRLPRRRRRELVGPTTVERLDIDIDYMPIDDIGTSHPVFFVTRDMAERLREADLSGFELATMTVGRSDYWEQTYAGLDEPALPDLVWLKVGGSPAADDFGLLEGTLVVSHRALEVLRTGRLELCDVTPFTPEGTIST